VFVSNFKSKLTCALASSRRGFAHRATRAGVVLFIILFMFMHAGAQTPAQRGWLWQNPLPQGNQIFAIVCGR
jgi:hypothetical protein